MDTFKRARLFDRALWFLIGAIVATAVQFFLIPAAHAQTLNNAALSNSASNSNATSGSISGSTAISDQAQNVTSNLGASQGNAQSITFNTQAQKRLDTNTAVPLAAAVSFSSDYCGGVASGGASAAGVSIGFAKPLVDGNCQSLRRAEKFGVMAVTARNMGANTTAARLLAMSVWELCTAEANSSYGRGDRKGEAGVPSTQAGCLYLQLVRPDDMPVAGATPADSIAAEIAGASARAATTPPPTVPARPAPKAEPDDEARKLKQTDEERKRSQQPQSAQPQQPPTVALQWSPARP